MSARTLRYRGALGGFVRLSHIQEVYDLDSSVYEKVKDRFFVDDKLVVKICLNTAPWIDLKRHTNIGYEDARAIDAYKRHNNIDSVDQMSTNPIITDTLF